jgi:inosine-uridine nucleoside N-ribohydrolase
MMPSVANANRTSNYRRLIVDTDLGLDDLVALAILRLQQCRLRLRSRGSVHHDIHRNTDGRLTQFRLAGVTITSGISNANSHNASLLRRLLPPDTPVFAGSGDLQISEESKPSWWHRTADSVEKFLSSLPSAERTIQSSSAEEFLASSLNDPNVDILCMAPLKTVAKAIDIQSSRQSAKNNTRAKLYIMGGIRSDSQATKRGVSTAPFGYHDFVGEMEDVSDITEQTTLMATSQLDQFGEFNFALDIKAARSILSTTSAHIIPLEACTLVPKELRCDETITFNLSSILSRNGTDHTDDISCDLQKEFHTARDILQQLLNEFGTNETQWDSITAAIYCNIFDSSLDTMIASTELSISDLGALTFPGCHSESTKTNADVVNRCSIDNETILHNLHSSFTMKDEATFFRFISHLLFSNERSTFDCNTC